MKVTLLSMCRVTALALLTYFVGLRLAQYLAYGPFYEMPDWMYYGIRFVLDHTGNADFRDPDDLSAISLLCTLLACWLLTAVVTITLYKLVYWLFSRQRNNARHN
jgi:hypothetical protein